VLDEARVPDDALDEVPPLPPTYDPEDGRFEEQAKRSPGVMQAMTTAVARVQVGFMTLRDRSIKGCSMSARPGVDLDSARFAACAATGPRRADDGGRSSSKR